MASVPSTSKLTTERTNVGVIGGGQTDSLDSKFDTAGLQLQ